MLDLSFCMRASPMGQVYVHGDIDRPKEINSSFWPNFQVLKPISPFLISSWSMPITLNHVLLPSEDNKIMFPHSVKQTAKCYTLAKVDRKTCFLSKCLLFLLLILAPHWISFNKSTGTRFLSKTSYINRGDWVREQIQSLLTYKYKLLYKNEKQILKTVVLLTIISSSRCVFCILFAIRRLFGCWSCLISWVIQTLNFQECGHYNSCLNSIFATSFEFYFRMFRTPWKAPERLPAFQTYCFLSPRCSSHLIAP